MLKGATQCGYKQSINILNNAFQQSAKMNTPSSIKMQKVFKGTKVLFEELRNRLREKNNELMSPYYNFQNKFLESIKLKEEERKKKKRQKEEEQRRFDKLMRIGFAAKEREEQRLNQKVLLLEKMGHARFGSELEALRLELERERLEKENRILVKESKKLDGQREFRKRKQQLKSSTQKIYKKYQKQFDDIISNRTILQKQAKPIRDLQKKRVEPHKVVNYEDTGDEYRGV